MCADNGRRDRDRHLFLSQSSGLQILLREGNRDGTPSGNRSSRISQAAVMFELRGKVRRASIIVANNGRA